MSAHNTFKFFFIIIFSVLYFLVRAPDYDIPLSGEDGIFADIFVNAPTRPYYGQNARINGNTVYSRLGHPSPLYEWQAISGKFFSQFFPLKKFAEEDHIKISKYLRFSFSCFQFTAWLFLFFLLFSLPHEKCNWNLLLILTTFALSPPAITYSLWIQVDNSSGPILIGVFMGIVFLWEHKKKLTTLKLKTLLFAAGFISALGKNEWSILVLLSLLASTFYLMLVPNKNRENESKKSELIKLLWIFLGLIIGNLSSYIFNPIDYMNGFNLMNSMSQKASIFNLSQLKKWWALTKIRMEVLYLSMALWLYISSIFLKKSPWKFSTPTVLSFFISSAFLWSFFLTSWDATDRYFIPAFVALFYTFALIRTTQGHFIDRFSHFIVFFLALDIANNYYLSTQNHQRRKDNISEYLNSLPTKQGCIHHINYYAFNFKHIDYVGVGNGPGNLEGHLKASGKEICKE